MGERIINISINYLLEWALSQQYEWQKSLARPQTSKKNLNSPIGAESWCRDETDNPENVADAPTTRMSWTLMTLWATISGWVCTSAHLTYHVLEVQAWTRVVVHHGGDWRGDCHHHRHVRSRCWLPSSWWTVRADWDLESFWSVVITNHHNTSKSCEVPAMHRHALATTRTVVTLCSPSVRHKFVSYSTQSFIVGSTTNTKYYCLLFIRCRVLLFFYPFSTKFYHLLSARCEVLLFFIHSTPSFTIYVTTKLQCE